MRERDVRERDERERERDGKKREERKHIRNEEENRKSFRRNITHIKNALKNALPP